MKMVWNGIKVDGELFKGFWSEGALRNSPEGTITFYARGTRLSAEIRKAFEVKNDSDSMTDYFENDRFRVEPGHPLYAEVKKACDARSEHYRKLQLKRAA